MIIQCPKCKAKFEINDENLKTGEVKFQCSDCAFIWNEYIKLQDVKETYMPQQKKQDTEVLPSCLTEEVEVKTESLPMFDDKNSVFRTLFVFLLALILFGIIFFIIQILRSENISSSGKNIFSDSEIEKIQSPDDNLYIELVTPLSLVKEGMNEYIIIRGFIYNPTNMAMDVPKLVIRLENADGRILQEQEREVETQILNPLEKADFMFKVFKFSSQVMKVRVDFVESGKI